MNTKSKFLSLFGVSTAGMVVFAGLYFFNPRTIPPTKVTTTVNTVVTNTVFQEVSTKPSDETLAQIDLGKRIYSALTNTVHDAAVLFAIKGVKVKYNLSGMTDVVSENDIKAKFELALRRNNVPIDPDATSFLIVSLTGMWVNNEREMFCWDTQCVLEEWQPIIRNGICHYATVTSWNKGGKLIITPSKDINSQILEETERMAEVFANDYLSANPKK